jgi:hypothetical protein
MERDEAKGMPPHIVARKIYKISDKKHPRPYYTAGLGYGLIMLLSRLLPARVVDFIVRKIYL